MGEMNHPPTTMSAPKKIVIIFRPSTENRRSGKSMPLQLATLVARFFLGRGSHLANMLIDVNDVDFWGPGGERDSKGTL